MKILRRILSVVVLLLLIAWAGLYVKLHKPGHSFPELGPIHLHKGATAMQEWPLGSFVVRWDATKAHMKVTHKDDPTHIVWQTIPAKGWLGMAKGKALVEEARGSFFVKDKISQRCEQQHISQFLYNAAQRTLAVKGHLRCLLDAKKIPYSFIWKALPSGHLHFTATLHHKESNRIYLRYAAGEKERFHGFGEQFTYFDLKGKRVPILVMEQGIGRGAQPITWAADLLARSGGDWHTSYASIPHYITSQMRSLFLENKEYVVFDLRPKHFVQIAAFAKELRGRVLYGKTPLSLIEQYTTYAGRMRALPEWIHEGAIIGMQGGTAKVRKILAQLKQQKAPISAFWLQDWVGQRTTSFGKQLWWNWTLDRDHYPQWEKLTTELKQQGARVLLYINPFLADVKTKKNASRNLFQEAEKLGLLAKTPEKKTYMIRNTSFSAALLDLTNPKANQWIKQVIQKEMLAIGASGWMADFGEAMPFDARLMKGKGADIHNQYPVMWAKTNREAIDSHPNGKEIVFFMRAGYTQSPRYSTLFWLGDQLVTWDRYDGIKTAVTGLLSGGISGYSLNHSDIGGYTTITHPIRNYHRSKELFMRWAELNAFSTVYRTHEGNRPAVNHQFHSDQETLTHFVRFAKVYKAWAPLRKRLVQEATTKGHPVARHPFLHYPNNKSFSHMESAQFMLGPSWMVIPVLNPGVRKVKVVLPQGKWVHLWTGKHFGSQQGDMSFHIPAPIGQPPVFYKQGDAYGEAFRNTLQQQGLLPTNTPNQ